MNAAPRLEGDYTARQVEAARRLLVDVGQVPQQLAIFHDSPNDDERDIDARRAFELVQKLLSLV